MGLYQTVARRVAGAGAVRAGVAGLGRAPGAVGWPPLLVGVCCADRAGAAAACDAPSRRRTRAPGTWHALRTVPLLAGIAFTGGVFEAGLGSVSAAYASATGLGLSAAASVAGAIGVGSFLCQYPAGMAADRFQPSTVFSAAALLLLAASAAVALADRAPWLLVGRRRGMGRGRRRALHPDHGARGPRVRGPGHRRRRGRDDHGLHAGRHRRPAWPAAPLCSGAASPGWRARWDRWRSLPCGQRGASAAAPA